MSEATNANRKLTLKLLAAVVAMFGFDVTMNLSLRKRSHESTR